MDTNQGNRTGPVIVSADHASGRDSEGSSLIPMLIIGLILVAVGAGVLMAFV